MDGAIAASGSDMNMGTALTAAATTTVSSVAVTMPAS